MISPDSYKIAERCKARTFDLNIINHLLKLFLSKSSRKGDFPNLQIISSVGKQWFQSIFVIQDNLVVEDDKIIQFLLHSDMYFSNSV